MKFPDFPEFQDEIRQASNAQECWRMGNSRKYKLRDDWESIKVDVMYQANLAKFQQKAEIREELLSTQGEVLEPLHGSAFWRTWNARIIARVREELKPNPDQE